MLLYRYLVSINWTPVPHLRVVRVAKRSVVDGEAHMHVRCMLLVRDALPSSR